MGAGCDGIGGEVVRRNWRRDCQEQLGERLSGAIGFAVG